MQPVKLSFPWETHSSSHTCHFYTGQQPANLAVLSVARCTDLDRRRCIGGLFWSANMTRRRVHFLPPQLLCKYVVDMLVIAWDGRRCRWRALLCDPQPGVLKPRQDEQLESCCNPGDASVSSVSVGVWLSACCCSGKLLMVATFKLKAPH